MSANATLGAAVDDRKARLAKLRSIKRKQPGDEIVPPESDRASPAIASLPTALHGEDGGADEVEGDVDGRGAAAADVAAVEPDVARLHLSGRNYDPETRGAKLGFETQPDLAAGDNTLEAKAAKLEEDVRRLQNEDGDGEGDGDGAGNGAATAATATAASSKPIDLFKLQPKRPNWDLKRELNKRLEPLNARTDNAIAKLLRSRLQQQQQQQQQPAEGAASSKAAGKAGESEEGVLEGAALVEGIRIREKEAEEEERRERELEEDDAS